MKHKKNYTLPLIIIAGILLSITAYFGTINSLTLRAEEPRRGVVAFEMTQSNNYAVPTLFGWKYYNKPPVYNWLIVITSKISGVFDNWVVRLPSLLSLLLLITLNFFFVRKFLNAEIAAITTILLVINVDFLFYGGVYTGEIDLFYSLVVYLQGLSIFYFGKKQKKLDLFLISYTLCAIGLLTKGLPSLAFQFFGLLAWALSARNFRILFHWTHLLGISILIILISLYFFIYSMYEDPWPFIHNLFLESSEKTAQGKNLLQILKALAMFPAILFKTLLPGIIFIVFFRKSTFLKAYKKNKYLKYITWFIILNIPIYWITPSFKIRYLYMLFPFITTILAILYINGKKHFPRLNAFIEKIFLAFIIIFCLGYIASYFINFLDQHDPSKLILTGILVSTLLVLFLYFKLIPYRIYLIMLSFLLFRIFLNYYYYPDFHSRYMKINTFIEDVINVTANEPVYYAGKSITKIVENSLTNKISHQDRIEITSVPPIHYQVAYYLGVHKNRVLNFTEETREDVFYISEKEFTENKAVTVYAETDQCLRHCKGYVLYKLKPPENEIVP